MEGNRITHFKNGGKINKSRYVGLNPKYSKSDEAVKLGENIVNEGYLDYSRIHSSIRYEDILNTEKRQMENYVFRNGPKKDEEIKNEEVTIRTLGNGIEKYIIDNQLEEKGFNVEIPTADDILRANNRDPEEFKKIKKGELYNKLVQKINNKPLFNKNKKITIKFKDEEESEHKLSFFINGPSKISDYGRSEEEKRLLPIKEFTGRLETIAYNILERNDVFVVNVTCNVNKNNNFYDSGDYITRITHRLIYHHNRMDFGCYDAIFAIEVHRGENNQYIKSLFKESINEVEVDENDKRLGNFGRPHLQICLLVGPEKGNELKISKIRLHFQENLRIDDVKVSKVEPPRGSKRKYLIASDIYNNSFGYVFKEGCAPDIRETLIYMSKKTIEKNEFSVGQFNLFYNYYFFKLKSFLIDFGGYHHNFFCKKYEHYKHSLLGVPESSYFLIKLHEGCYDEFDHYYKFCDILFIGYETSYVSEIKNKMFGYTNINKLAKDDVDFIEIFQIFSSEYFNNKKHLLTKKGSVHMLMDRKSFTYEKKGIDLKDFIFKELDKICDRDYIDVGSFIKLLDERNDFNKKGLLSKLLNGLLLKGGRNIDEEIIKYIEFEDYIIDLELNKLLEKFNSKEYKESIKNFRNFEFMNLYYMSSLGDIDDYSLIKDQKFITFTSVDERYESYINAFNENSIIRNVLNENLIDVEKFMYAYGSLIVNKKYLKKTGRAPYIWGRSRTGKSTLIARLLEEFLTAGNIELLSASESLGERFKFEGIVNKKIVILDEFSLEPSWIKSHNLAILNSLFGRENIIVKRKYKDSVLYHHDAASVAISNYSPYIGKYYENVEGYKAFLNRIFPFGFFKSSEGKEDVEFESNVLKEMPAFIIRCVEIYNQHKEGSRDFLMKDGDKIEVLYNFGGDMYDRNSERMVRQKDFCVKAKIGNMFMGNAVFIKQINANFTLGDSRSHRFKFEVENVVIETEIDDYNKEIDNIVNKEWFKKNFELSRDGFEKLLKDNGYEKELEEMRRKTKENKSF